MLTFTGTHLKQGRSSAKSEEKMASTIKDIRAETGLGLATISKYLNGGNVRAENRQKIEEAIKKLDYHPNEMARGLVTKRTKTIGFVVNKIASTFSGVLLQHTSAYLHEKGYSMMICDSNNNEEMEADNIKFCLEKLVDGILLIPVSKDPAMVITAKKAGVPVVLLDRELPGSELDSVVIDNRSAAEGAVEELIRKGHKRIAMIHSEEYTGMERFEGYKSAMKRAGLKVPKQYEYKQPVHSPELGYEGMQSFLNLKEPPTAVILSNYEVTLGVLMTINERGIHCPEDVSIIGFDELMLPMVMELKLTIVQQPMEEICAEGVRILLKRIEEKKDFRPQKVILHASTKQGESIKEI